MTPATRAAIIDFATRSFRDVADRDYVAARVCHRLGLEQQFLWMALQATEKYLKGILLFNFQTTKPYGHRVKQAFDALTQIKDIPFVFPKDIGPFLQYLEAQGANRYFTQPFYTLGEEIFLLDKTVWHLRLYCRFLRQGKFQSPSSGRTHDWFDLNVAQIEQQRRTKTPRKVRIFAGYLEKVFDGRHSEQREALVWKNPYYGRTTKSILKNVTIRSSSGNPTHFMHPEIFDELEKLVKFEPHVRQQFSNVARASNASP